MGEFLEIVDRNLNLVVIDGYRLVVKSCLVDSLIENIKVIIFGKIFIDVNSLFFGEDNVKVGFNEKNVIFIINDMKIIIRLFEGDFIDYKKLLLREYNSRVKLNIKEFLNSIERVFLLF